MAFAGVSHADERRPAIQRHNTAKREHGRTNTGEWGLGIRVQVARYTGSSVFVVHSRSESVSRLSTAALCRCITRASSLASSLLAGEPNTSLPSYRPQKLWGAGVPRRCTQQQQHRRSSKDFSGWTSRDAARPPPENRKHRHPRFVHHDCRVHGACSTRHLPRSSGRPQATVCSRWRGSTPADRLPRRG